MISSACLVIALGCLNCGGGGIAQPGPSPVAQQPASPANTVQAGQLRTASGDPIGIRITWPSVDQPDVTGYHLYKSSTPILDSARGDESFWVPVVENATTGGYLADAAGNTLIPQPAAPGELRVDDLFPVAIGEQYYYRVCAVDLDSDESKLSAETLVTITVFQVDGLAVASAGVGDDLTINGARFGQYDAATDRVLFAGVAWDAAAGFIPAELPAPVVSWDEDKIVVTVPDGTTTGKILVEITGQRQSTPDDFTNTDPYITEVTPLSGTVLDLVTVRGANFGAAADDSHQVWLAQAAVPTANIKAYSDTEISFNPAWNGIEGDRAIFVQVAGIKSNEGRFSLLNSPPAAGLTASMTVALAPAFLLLNASNTVDQESLNSQLTFDYDWEGDGIYDRIDAGANVYKRYSSVGTYNTTVRVTDPQGLSDTASVTIQIVDRTMLNDNGSPSAGRYYQDNGPLELRYTVAGGLGPYTVTWTLQDTTGIAADTRLASDTVDTAGSYSHGFTLDTTQTTPVEDSNVIPRGTWRIRGAITDATTVNDPDGTHTWPSAADQYDIYRFSAIVVRDVQGDSTGSAANELQSLLTELGYYLPDAPVASDAVSLDQIKKYSVALWPAASAAGNLAPFEWLSAADTALMRAYLDAGGNVVLLGPPALASATVFPDDAVFDTTYQPFSEVLPEMGPLQTTLFARDFTANYQASIASMAYRTTLPFNVYGKNVDAGLLPGAVSQFDDAAVPDPATGPVAAIRPSPNPGGGNLYFGMFTFSNITSYEPSPVRDADLLDNITAGTINF